MMLITALRAGAAAAAMTAEPVALLQKGRLRPRAFFEASVMTDPANDFPVWRTPEGEPVSCVEKIKVLNENLAELRELAQEALEDAVLMGCDEAQVRAVLAGIVADLVNPYRR